MTNYKDRLRTVLGFNEKQKLTDEEKIILFSKIRDGLQKRRKAKIRKIGLKVAASLGIFATIALGLYVFKKSDQLNKQGKRELTQTDLFSEGHGAILTLSDGSKLNLTTHKTILKNQGVNGFDLSPDSVLRYNTLGKEESNISMNTLEVPKKYTFQVILADGTKVWLNADSKLTYPTRFIDKQRKVELIGEAYFEVASNKEKPFIVLSNNQKIEVIGTHFNVQSYPNKPVITSLLEGKVLVNSLVNNNSKFLVSGDQSQINVNGEIKVSHFEDISTFAEWKEGYSQLNGTPLAEVMEILTRWYDFDYSFANNQLRDVKLYGKIHKSNSLDHALQILSQLDIHYRINKSNSGDIEVILKSNNN